jgi:hypothetical protein
LVPLRNAPRNSSDGNIVEPSLVVEAEDVDAPVEPAGGVTASLAMVRWV